MKKTTKIVAIVVIVALLIISVGYALIENITLNVTGTAGAITNQDNFTVEFSGEPTTTTTAGTATASITENEKNEKLNATMTVAGLTASGDVATATYTIQNTSDDLSAALSATVSNNTNTDYFDVTYHFGNTETTKTETIEHGAATTVTVTVKLLKTPVEAAVNSTIGLTITAEPVQPKN